MKRIANQKSQPKSVEPEPGCWKCGHCRVSCPIVKEGTHFTSNNTKRKYPIRQKLNCDSSYVIYLGTCKKCGGQYVGKSQTPFKKRHSNHKQEVRKSIGGLGHHYGGDGCGYESISIQAIPRNFLAEPTPLLCPEWGHCPLLQKREEEIIPPPSPPTHTFNMETLCMQIWSWATLVMK